MDKAGRNPPFLRSDDAAAADNKQQRVATDCQRGFENPLGKGASETMLGQNRTMPRRGFVRVTG
jgi:hypothetical protein